MSGNITGRRSFLKASVAAAVAASIPSAEAREKSSASGPAVKPNIVVFISDQFRPDFIGANGHNGTTHTPNLDSLANRGKNFTHAVTNQPFCSPSRSVIFTSRYATETGVWRLGLTLNPTLPTLAGELRKAGYSTNYVGKWHLALEDPKVGGTSGPVKNPADRGGFDDLWEAANAIENVTHPYQGAIWDRDNEPLEYKDEYRVDFLTDRAERFLRQKHDKPFFLVVSQLEPHQQNDLRRPVAPKGAAARFANPTVPPDVRSFPGSWQAYLPDYYGCVEAIDASVGRIRRILEEEHLADNTIFAFISDHGCHFETRNRADKCSAHNASIRVPLLIDGPGFRGGQQIPELVGLIDLAPTVLEAAGVPVPSSWKGRSLLPLVNEPQAAKPGPTSSLSRSAAP
jgi:arylsulfatase A-like enzyme